MIKQSNIKFDLELTRNLMKKDNSTKTKSQLMEKNYICQRYAARHGLIVTTTTNKSKLFTSSNQQSTKLTHQIQETNINTTIIDILEKSSNDCPLIETSFKERIDKYFNKKDNQNLIISTETKQNLNKLQKITNDVKLLTKQLQLSIEFNKNNNSSIPILDERLLGEICYQLERRILVIILSKSKQFYGYSLRYLSLIIENELNKHDQFIYKKRFIQIKKFLLKTNFHFNYHSIITFYFINKYGIYSNYQWLNIYSNILSNINQLKNFCYKILSKKFHEDFTIIINSLELISNFDHKPLFYW
ncbi:unnamed protein product [Rotaria sordida]|uniref:Speriolin C-terminal domain-containing protein n=1 Tax=Rotaria sordida TaxID=392033 RepID=A0A818NYB4_9BILA|nr:unnamed protein product [Rotaria sordida]CAF0973510.1 unnamed protein product [Rotaria sordida]CAF1011724.1 unnamed protein product [Rotaria sordida]CAF1075219.1 unnamed protein product [Rotaria sordida]CAF1159639.1 unnamed protein product [Rotaria sordida]